MQQIVDDEDVVHAKIQESHEAAEKKKIREQLKNDLSKHFFFDIG